MGAKVVLQICMQKEHKELAAPLAEMFETFRSSSPSSRAVPRTVEACRGDARWPGAFSFSNLRVEDHSYAYTPLTEVIAASVPFLHWHGQCHKQLKYVEVVLGGQLRSQTCL